MKWIDLTDSLFCKTQDHIFMIQKPRYRNDVVEWACFNANHEIVANGKTIRITAAKATCKALYTEIKAARKGVFVKKNGKLKAVV